MEGKKNEYNLSFSGVLVFRFWCAVAVRLSPFRLKSILHDYVLKLKLYRTYNDSYKTATHTRNRPTDQLSACLWLRPTEKSLSSQCMHKTMDETPLTPSAFTNAHRDLWNT